MGTLIANAATTQNLTGAATFAAAEVGALALNLVRNTTATLTTASTVTSATFTVTAAKVIDGVLLYLCLTTAANAGTGTFKVDLQKAGVSQASVTVNKSDLPSDAGGVATPSPVFFKFTGTATGDGAATWTLVLTTTSGTGSSSITYAINAAGVTNLTRALRTTTAATAAAADDLYIVGDLTGAGTKTTRTVTMNSTAATAYGNGALNSTTVNGGNVTVSNWGTLTYGNSVSTAYILRVAGDLNVWQNGLLNIGSSGAEIPRNSTAVLEFQPVSADGDFGLRLRDYGVANIYGLSRTSGKNVTRCKSTGNISSTSLIGAGASVLANNGSFGVASVGADGTSQFAGSFTDSAANLQHFAQNQLGLVATATTHSTTVWLGRGSGANNRFVRALVGGATDGYFIDIDLQLGTIASGTFGTGVHSSSSISALVGVGYVLRMTGVPKASGGTFQCSVNLYSGNASGSAAYIGAGTQCFIWDHWLHNTQAAYSDTTLNVDADTGWLSGDVIAVASTSKTLTDSETLVLNANAGVSSMVTTLSPGGIPSPNGGSMAHSGTAPTAGEIGLITRNVKIRSTSATFMAYVHCTGSAVFTAQWAEFYYIGSAAVTKRGIEIDGMSNATAGAKSITFCSIHDCDANGLYLNVSSQTSVNVTFSNNVLWNSLSAVAMTVVGQVTNADYTFASNMLSKVSTGMTFGDVSGTCTNNYISSAALCMSFAQTQALGTFSGNECHSSTNGVQVGSVTLQGAISFPKIWRCTTGLLNSGGLLCSELSFNNVTIFGNTTNISWSAASHLTINGASNIIAGDTSFPSTTGISISSGASVVLALSNLDMSGTGTGLAPHTTSDILFTANSHIVGVLNNVKFGAPTPLNSKTNWYPSSYIAMERYGGVAGDHRTEMFYGQIRTDPTIYRVTAPSVRLTPISATAKLESAPKNQGRLGVVVSGTARHVSVYVRKSQGSDGAAYNGNQPRLIQRANAALGAPIDVVLDTMVVAVGTWEKLEADTSVPTDAGAFEFIVDGDGTAGWLNINDWAIT